MTSLSEQPNNAIILGMPCSGIRVTAAIFARQGYFLVSDATVEAHSGDEYNPSDHSEAMRLVEHNATLLRRSGFRRHNTWLFDRVTDQQTESLRTMRPTPEDHAFAADCAARRPWLWSDSRLCYTLAYWWRLIDQENTRVLVLQRRPEETWKDFLHLGWRDDTKANRADVLSRIDHHLDAAMLCIERHRIPHLVVHYDQFLAAPATTAARIGQVFGLSLAADDLGVHAMGEDKLLNSVRFAQRISALNNTEQPLAANVIQVDGMSTNRDIAR